MNIEFFRQSFEKIKFYENPSSGRRIVWCGLTDLKVREAFRNFANAPNWKWSISISIVAVYTDCEASNKITYRCWFLENLISCTIYRFIFNLTPWEYQTSCFGELLGISDVMFRWIVNTNFYFEKCLNSDTWFLALNKRG